MIDPFEKNIFCDFSKLDATILDKRGIYCIRLKNSSHLPNRYQKILIERNSNIIYIGIARGQNLRVRLNQEIYHTKPGSFFRSIGAVLGFSPIPGHLKGRKNQRNYKFSKEDTKKITKWLLQNAQFSIYPIIEDFSIEIALIGKYCPLLNYTHNPNRLIELKEDRKKCKEIAIGSIKKV